VKDDLDTTEQGLAEEQRGGVDTAIAGVSPEARRRHAGHRGPNDGPGDRDVTLTRQQYEYWHHLTGCGERTLAILLSRSLSPRAMACCLLYGLV